MTYQQLIDNALWGYVQPTEGWQAPSVKMKYAEDDTAGMRTIEQGGLDESNSSTVVMTKLDADYRPLNEVDPLLRLVDDPSNNMFVNGEVDELTVTPVFCRRSFEDDICFGGTSFEECLATLDRM